MFNKAFGYIKGFGAAAVGGVILVGTGSVALLKDGGKKVWNLIPKRKSTTSNEA